LLPESASPGNKVSMSAPAEKIALPPPSVPDFTVDVTSDRRADVDSKQVWIASLLQEVKCDGLLVLDPDNFGWLGSGGAARGILDPQQLPALYFSPEQRWVLSSNADSQRLFDEELDGLGFQLKEWPWHWGREQLLADLCQKRRLACDVQNKDCVPVGDRLRQQRRILTRYEQACYRSLGHIVSHALEATCRTMAPHQTERELAGQLGHRLYHRGAQPVVLGVAADARARVYRQCGYTATPVSRFCLLSVTARKYGLCVTASRSVSFGPLDESLRKEHDAACKVSAAYVASTWPDALPREIFNAGRRIYLVTGYEHEWRQSPQGFITGHAVVELPLTAQTEELLQADSAVTWRSSVGAATSCDTYLVTDQGPEIMTPTEMWPLRRIQFQGVEFARPYPLER
jgi:Xaa-Pro dipeptidase